MMTQGFKTSFCNLINISKELEKLGLLVQEKSALLKASSGEQCAPHKGAFTYYIFTEGAVVVFKMLMDDYGGGKGNWPYDDIS